MTGSKFQVGLIFQCWYSSKSGPLLFTKLCHQGPPFKNSQKRLVFWAENMKFGSNFWLDQNFKLDLYIKIDSHQNRVQLCSLNFSARWRISKVAILADFDSYFGSPDFIYGLARLVWGSNDGELIDDEFINLNFENSSPPKGCYGLFCEKANFRAGHLAVDFGNNFRKHKMISEES